jgi:hypothetical protein
VNVIGWRCRQRLSPANHDSFFSVLAHKFAYSGKQLLPLVGRCLKLFPKTTPRSKGDRIHRNPCSRSLDCGLLQPKQSWIWNQSNNSKPTEVLAGKISCTWWKWNYNSTRWRMLQTDHTFVAWKPAFSFDCTKPASSLRNFFGSHFFCWDFHLMAFGG